MLLVLLGTAVCAAHNVSGTITCDGQGVAGVAVSDGYEVVVTDANGYYAMSSSKLNGYIFYTLPGGYEPLVADGFNPQFWAPLESSDITVDETHDFTLRRVDNDRHTVIIGADTHQGRQQHVMDQQRAQAQHDARNQKYPLEPLSIVVFPLDDNGVAYADDQERAQAQNQPLQVICFQEIHH